MFHQPQSLVRSRFRGPTNQLVALTVDIGKLPRTPSTRMLSQSRPSLPVPLTSRSCRQANIMAFNVTDLVGIIYSWVMSRSADCWEITRLNPLKPRHHLRGPHPPAHTHSLGSTQNHNEGLRSKAAAPLRKPSRHITAAAGIAEAFRNPSTSITNDGPKWMCTTRIAKP